MIFEYDPHKSELNKIKHGIDFEEAQALWNDEYLLKISARSTDEPRFLAIGRIGQKYWSAIFTTRNQAIRLISVRRAREEEITLYESH